MAQLPELIKPIYEQKAVVGRYFELDLSEYIQNPESEEPLLVFFVSSEDGFPLPLGLSYLPIGVISGVPEPESYRPQGYTLYVRVSNSAPGETVVAFRFMIDRLEDLDPDDDFTQAIDIDEEDKVSLEERLMQDIVAEAELKRDKKKVWSSIMDEDFIPQIQTIYDRAVTPEEVSYLIERMAFLAIWNIDNPNQPGDLKAIVLEGSARDHFHVYDRDSCLVATPKKLFDHARTLKHAIDTAQAMSREAFARGWRVEFGGFEKMIRAAWVEMECLAEKNNKKTDYVYFFPSQQDVELLQQQIQR